MQQTRIAVIVDNTDIVAGAHRQAARDAGRGAHMQAPSAVTMAAAPADSRSTPMTIVRGRAELSASRVAGAPPSRSVTSSSGSSPSPASSTAALRLSSQRQIPAHQHHVLDRGAAAQRGAPGFHRESDRVLVVTGHATYASPQQGRYVPIEATKGMWMTPQPT